MNCVIQLSYFYLIPLAIPVVSETARFTSVSLITNTPLYAEIGNEDAPPETDPVLLDRQMRTHICRDIADSGYLRAMDVGPFIDDRHQNLLAYKLQHFESGSRDSFKEYVFECKFTKLRDILFFYVSKEYNTSPVHHSYVPGRFVFVCYSPEILSLYLNHVLLAEGPAKPYIEPRFNVEIYHLQIRMFAHLVERKVDPLCRMISGRDNLYYHRVCTSVCTNILPDVGYAGYAIPSDHFCRVEEVGLRTENGATIHGQNTYRELMTSCDCIFRELDLEVTFYISRAYFSNQILVYRRDPSDEIIYLENLSTNVAIVDEVNSFDFLED